MSKHTPGPWNLDLHPTSCGSMYRIQQARACIYVDHMYAPNVKDTAWDEDHANARLIAAAPDLLEALEYAENLLIEYIVAYDKEFGSARSAAELEDAGEMYELTKIRAAIAKAKGETP